MALKFPTPPTPPTPPSSPFVDMGDAQAGISQSAEESSVNENQNMVIEIPRPRIVTPGKITVTQPPPSDQSSSVKKSETPEVTAREHVANGGGALTKRTVTRTQDEEEIPSNQQVIRIPSDADRILNNADRGQDVLREFSNEKNSSESHQAVETPSTFKVNNQSESHGGLFWIATIIFIGILSFIVVKKFLFTEKPALKTTDLFEDSGKRLKKVSERVAKTNLPPTKVVKSPKKDDDDKGSLFEVRV